MNLVLTLRNRNRNNNKMTATQTNPHHHNNRFAEKAEKMKNYIMMSHITDFRINLGKSDYKIDFI